MFGLNFFLHTMGSTGSTTFYIDREEDVDRACQILCGEEQVNVKGFCFTNKHLEDRLHAFHENERKELENGRLRKQELERVTPQAKRFQRDAAWRTLEQNFRSNSENEDLKMRWSYICQGAKCSMTIVKKLAFAIEACQIQDLRISFDYCNLPENGINCLAKAIEVNRTMTAFSCTNNLCNFSPSGMFLYDANNRADSRIRQAIIKSYAPIQRWNGEPLAQDILIERSNEQFVQQQVKAEMEKLKLENEQLKSLLSKAPSAPNVPAHAAADTAVKVVGLQCGICYRNDVLSNDMKRIHPCGHTVCSKCASKLQNQVVPKCPFCAVLVEEFQRTYISVEERE